MRGVQLMNVKALHVLLAVSLLLAGGLVWVLNHGSGRGPEAPTASTAGADLRLARIEAALAELREAIDRLEVRSTVGLIPPPAEGGRSPADAGDDLANKEAQPGVSGASGSDLAGLEVRLMDELARLREELRQDLDRELIPTRIREAGLAIDWGAIEEVVALWHEDPAKARSEVKLLTTGEVLARFGPPSDVLVNSNGLTWLYAMDPDPSTGKLPLEMILRIPDGYVVQLAVRDQRR